jgi:hypothetical protein
LISAHMEEVQVFQPQVLKAKTRLDLVISGGLMLGLAGTAVAGGWWGIVRGPALLTRTDNLRRTIADRYVKRGTILDSHERPLAESTGKPGDYIRDYPYPALGPLVGYTDQVYGQAGLEASLDPYLRGLQGYPALTTWWEHLLYGQPPPGLNVSTSIDTNLQSKADELLAGHKGALVLLNAHTGEILSMASSPTFDANQLSDSWESLVNDPNSPLFDRAGMGLYPTGSGLGAFLLAYNQIDPNSPYPGSDLADCALVPTGLSWGEVISAGCPQATRQLLSPIEGADLISLLGNLGLYTAPSFPVETLSSTRPAALSDMYAYLSGEQPDPVSGATLAVSPLQMALAAATLSNAGEIIAPHLVMGVETPLAGWVSLPANGAIHQSLSAAEANTTAAEMPKSDLPAWEVVSTSQQSGNAPTGNEQNIAGNSWYLGGTSPDWNGAPLALAVLLEEKNPQLAQEIGRSMFRSAIYP